MSKKRGGSTPGSPENQARKREERKAQARKKRRKRLLMALSIVALTAVAAGAGITLFNRRAEAVRDISAVGQGVPAVVQVHDNTCPICTELRSTVARIEGEFADDNLLIRVADIHTDEGLAFAARYTSARRATLLFIDGRGNLVAEQSGAQAADVLRRNFELHAAGELE